LRQAGKVSECRQPAFQIGALDAVRNQRKGAPICVCRRLERAEPAQHIGAGSMKQVVSIELPRGTKFVDKSQPSLRSLGHPYRDGAVQSHHRARLDPRQLAVKRRDLRPISRRGASGFGMQRTGVADVGKDDRDRRELRFWPLVREGLRRPLRSGRPCG
jgi:hypothetical protein